MSVPCDFTKGASGYHRSPRPPPTLFPPSKASRMEYAKVDKLSMGGAIGKGEKIFNEPLQVAAAFPGNGFGVPKFGCFKPGSLHFLRACGLLRSCAPFSALLRSFALFCARLRLFPLFYTTHSRVSASDRVQNDRVGDC